MFLENSSSIKEAGPIFTKTELTNQPHSFKEGKKAMDFNLLEQKMCLILHMALQKNVIGKSIIITLPVYSPVSNQKKIDVLKICGDLQTKMIAWTFSSLDFYSGRLTNVEDIC